MTWRACCAGLLTALGLQAQVHAAEGLWLLSDLPLPALAAHGAPHTAQGLQAWLRPLQGAAVRLNGGSAAFVSPQGLLLTNHHVVSDCIDALSGGAGQDDPLTHGFRARTRADERRCPGLEAQVVERIDTHWQAPCPPLRHCEVVAHRGSHQRERQVLRVFKDVRLVYAPPLQAANFGGDRDNFEFPRHAFDFAFLRVMDTPARAHRPAHWLRASGHAVQPGQPLFALGFPGHTERHLPVAYREALRNEGLPVRIGVLRHLQAALQAFAAQGDTENRLAKEPLYTVENALKAFLGEQAALLDRRARLTWRQATPGASAHTAALAEAAARELQHNTRLRLALEPPWSSLLAQALRLAALQHEARLPTDQRLKAYTGGAALAEREALLADRPLHPALEALWLQVHGEQLAWALPESHPVRQTLPDLRPDTPFAQPAQRRAWLGLPPDRFDALPDPWVQWGRAAYAVLRPWLLRQAQGIEAPLAAASRAPAAAPNTAPGSSQDRGAPDADGSLRLSFGQARPPHSADGPSLLSTTLASLLARAQALHDEPDFALPPGLQDRLPAARPHDLAPHLDTPLNFTASLDLTGGSSGSPVLDATGAWVGVLFDSNREALAGRFFYDGERHRAIVVHREAIELALRRLWPLARLHLEMRPAAPAQAPGRPQAATIRP